MTKKLLVCFVFAGLAVAGAKTYSLRLLQPVMLGGAELKAGEYDLEVAGDKAVVHAGKTKAEAPVKVETVDSKYPATVVRLAEIGGKMHVSEIRLGGTKTKLVFSE
jgi:hypothetical protein